MLAYVFWHYPRADVGAEAYERNMLVLHERLHEAGAVIDSVTFRVREVTWVNSGGTAYEDWYLVPGWPELGALNVSAVSADRKPPHDDVASEYAAGSGGIYELRSGDPAIRDAASAQWIAKPRGMRYPEFDALLAPSIGSGAVWRRQMVLGPGTEFCLTGPSAAELAPPLTGSTFERTLLTAEHQ